MSGESSAPPARASHTPAAKPTVWLLPKVEEPPAAATQAASAHADATSSSTTTDDTIDVRGAMAVLRLGRNAVYDACTRREIPHRRIGKLLRFSRAGLQSWLAGSTPNPTSPEAARG